MLSDKRYDELKKLFKEAVMESLVEEELTEGLNIKDCINFVKNLISKAKELGIKVDSDLEQEVNTTTESIELTEGFMDWLRSKKDKIFSLMLSIMVATNFPAVASAMEFKNLYNTKHTSTAIFELNSKYDLFTILNKFGDLLSYQWGRIDKKDAVRSKKLIVGNEKILSDANHFIGYTLKVIDEGSNIIHMYIYDRDGDCKMAFQVPREQLDNQSLKNFLKNHNYHIFAARDRLNYELDKSENNKDYDNDKDKTNNDTNSPEVENKPKSYSYCLYTNGKHIKTDDKCSNQDEFWKSNSNDFFSNNDDDEFWKTNIK